MGISGAKIGTRVVSCTVYLFTSLFLQGAVSVEDTKKQFFVQVALNLDVA